MPKLTKSVVDNAEVRERPYFIWCSDLSGFGVRVFPSGKRTYYADYYNRDGARKRMSIGPHGKLTTEEARKLAMITLGSVLKGEDPAAERATRRTSITVAELCDQYFKAAETGMIAGKGGRPKKSSTLVTDTGRVERHIKPLLGKRLVRDLDRADVTRFMRDVAAGKTATVEKTKKKRGKAVVRGGTGTASRTVGLLGGILTYAVSEGIIEQNPAAGLKRLADKRRERRLDRTEYRAIGSALASSTETDLEQAVAGIWLLALTGCRLGEIRKLKWSEVDRAGGCFRLEDSKEGATVRPVGRAVFELLEGLTRKDGGAYVLPAARGDGPFGGMPGAIIRTMKRAGLTGVTAHTFRHSYATAADELGFTEATIRPLLGHAGHSVTSRYIHKLDSVLVAAADKVARSILSMMTGETAKVIDLPSSNSRLG